MVKLKRILTEVHLFANDVEDFAISQYLYSGSFLSGGEKQRLNIARIAYLNPEIILLDEATSALDSKNEKEVHAALEKLMENKTSIIISATKLMLPNIP